jgi:hypothetical protein
MRTALPIRLAIAIAGMLVSLSSFGCGSSSSQPAVPVTPVATKEHAHSHDSWWCDEHGVPEEICALCDEKVAAKLKKQGDWCKEHDVPASQCFVCHPELKAKFAAQYEAKYGKQPPETEIK